MRARMCTAAAVLLLAGTVRADLPPGFTRTALWTSPGGVSAIAPLPDGRVLAAALFGPITLIESGQPARQLINIPGVVTTDEHGILGMTIDPAFSSNGYFYILYTGDGPYNLVARYTFANEQVDPASRVVIWQNPGLCPGASHQGGAINFGSDGNLYIATGEQFDEPLNAQTLANQHGKILRLAPDGSIPPDNPFVNTPGAQAAIWCYGLRNPFRFSVDRLTGTLWIGDVGGGTYEEINRGQAGVNYGWPYMEGPLCSVPSCAAFTGPVWSYIHGDPIYTPNGEAAVICGPIYRGTSFPSEYRGNLFYADFANGWIKRLVFDTAGNVVQDLPFDTSPSVFTLVDFKLGWDGALYYALLQDTPFSTAGVYRISATQPGNQAPIVAAAGAPLQGNAPLTVQFSSAGTFDPDNGPQPLSYAWAFGDGQVSSLPSPGHQYVARGLYHATLTVTDGADPVTSAPIDITVGHAPVPTIGTPGAGFEYSAGDTISYSGSAVDFEDGTLPPSAFTWSFSLLHLSHAHPAFTPVTGVQSGSFVIPSTGHDPEHTHYRITLTVRDSDNIPATIVRDLVPRVSPIAFNTSPQGIPVFLDGRALATPYDYESLVGFEHQVAAQPSFSLNGLTYQFVSWSGGQPATFGFISPVGGAAFTAMYSIACYANCDGSSVAPILNVLDFGCFLNKYAAQDPYANCDNSSNPPVLNSLDFACFLNRFAAGCT